MSSQPCELLTSISSPHSPVPTYICEKPAQMNSLRFLFAAAFVALLSCQSQAQPNWQVGNTTLTEYDLVTGISLPWEILWGADDHIWCTLRTGQVLRIDPETGNYTEILDIEVMGDGGSEPGLLGMCLHPDFETTPLVYLVYNSGSPWSGGTEHLVSYEWDGTSLSNQVVILEDIEAGGIHNGSRIMITEDGKIMMTTGDTGDGGDSSQNMNSNNGKVLRINLDGTIPADNPNPDSYVWSMGHRNAQGICQGPNGIIYSSEHGQSNHDEFNIIEADRNYGWPDVEGICDLASEGAFCAANNVMEPLKEWSPCIAVNGIEYYNHPSIPEWQNSVLMSVLGGLGGAYERLSVLHMNDDGTAVESEDQFFSDFNQRIRDVCVNPYTGAVYLAFNGPSYPGSGPNTIKEFVNDGVIDNVIDRKQDQFISIYPNPVTTQAKIEFSKSLIGSDLVIHDYTGKVVESKEITSTQMTIEKGFLPAGQYYIQASSSLGTLSKSFIIQ